MPPIELLRSKNTTIVVGTDSYASNWSLNMLDELKMIHKHNPSISLSEMLSWITINGARALQMEDKLGSIEIGKKPGLTLINNLSAAEKLQTTSSSTKII